MRKRKKILSVFQHFAGIAALLMGCVFLVSCADDDNRDAIALPVHAVPTDPDPVGLRLAQAAERATAAQNRMAQIESFRTPLPPLIDPSPLPGLMQITSITWTGPIEQIARTLAEMGSLEFKTTGKEPPLPLVVSVDAHQQPIGKILQDIGLQAGRRADIIVNPGTRTLDLRYAPTDGILTQY
jgi:defect-in-organelle-trafficking protein DotD